MERRLKRYQFIGFTFTCLLGTLLHFLYDFFQGSKIVAAISAVNESTWEHMKLMYFPLLVFSVAESKILKEQNSFWKIKFKGLLLSLLLIPLLFYTYKGVLGFNLDWINISIFFISAAVGFIYETRKFIENKAENNNNNNNNNTLYFAFYVFVGVLFVVFTFYTPKLGIFSDPLTNSYGLQ